MLIFRLSIYVTFFLIWNKLLLDYTLKLYNLSKHTIKVLTIHKSSYHLSKHTDLIIYKSSYHVAT